MRVDTSLESDSWGDLFNGSFNVRPFMVELILLLRILDIHIFHFPLEIFSQIHDLAIIFILQFNLSFLSVKFQSSFFFVLLNHSFSNSFISVWIVVSRIRVVNRVSLCINFSVICASQSELT